MTSDKASMVFASRNLSNGNWQLNSRLTRDMTWVARSEWPPNSKKSS